MTYTAVFRQLLIINGNLSPVSVLIDLEIAIKNALEAVFPGVVVKGRLFYFTQNIYRKIKANGLQEAGI